METSPHSAPPVNLGSRLSAAIKGMFAFVLRPFWSFFVFTKGLCCKMILRAAAVILRREWYRDMLARLLFRDMERNLRQMYGPNEWGTFLMREDPSVLRRKISALAEGLDNLSIETATKLYQSRRHTACDLLPMQGMKVPCFCPFLEEHYQKLLRQAETVKIPFILPDGFYALPDAKIGLADDYGLSEFPSEVQKSLAGRTVIDGGGFCGDSALAFAKYLPEKIYAFEPERDSFRLLQETLQRNHDKIAPSTEIIPIASALGKERGTLTLRTSGALDIGASTHRMGYSPAGVKSYEVPMVSIDEFVQEHSLDVGFIKLDVEGAESDVIDGALETITKHKPVLAISIYHTPQDFFNIKPKLESLNLGYKFMIRHHAPNCPHWEYVLLAFVPGS